MQYNWQSIGAERKTERSGPKSQEWESEKKIGAERGVGGRGAVR